MPRPQITDFGLRPEDADAAAHRLHEYGLALSPEEAAFMLIDMGEFTEEDFDMELRNEDGSAKLS